MTILPHPWNLRRWSTPFPLSLRYGFFTGQRKTNARFFYPGPRERAAIGEPAEPFWYVFDFAPTSRDSGNSEVVPANEVAVLAMMATSLLASGTSKLICKQPIYNALAENFMRGLTQEKKAKIESS